MIYLKTLNIWDHTIHTALINGQLKLQCGQWVKCGTDGEKSRFISVDTKSKVINAVHANGGNKQFRVRFLQRARLNKLSLRTDLTGKERRQQADKILNSK